MNFAAPDHRQSNTEIAACDNKKQLINKNTNTPTMDGGAVQLAYSAGAGTAAAFWYCALPHSMRSL
jgi:hypothetical protein